MAQISARRSRIGLITLAVLFLGPMLAAIVAYKTGWQPGGLTAQGQLLSPARPAPELPLSSGGVELASGALLRGKWTLLYYGDNDCAQGCQQALYNMRQVWKSLGRKRKRVQGVYLLYQAQPAPALQDFLAAEHAGLILAQPSAAAAEWNRYFALEGSIAPLAADNIYLIDPLGNWVLYYQPDDPAKGLLKDLKKLLRTSQIG